MPREKVPYGGICGQAQKQKEMDVQLNKKLETVNGVSGDAAHDLKIIGEGNIKITNNESKNQIMLKVPNVVDVDHAEEADHATNADLATQATSADYAKTAGHATKADLATQATSAQEAADAENAVNAEEADHAKKADYATRAGEANVAYDATRATTADLATRAISADNADTASEASNAEYAQEAIHASFADTATKAISADDANYAKKADMIGELHESDLIDVGSDQNVIGTKTFNIIKFPNNGLNAVFDGIYAGVTPSTDLKKVPLRLLDKNLIELGMFQLVFYSNGHRELRIGLRAKNLAIVYATILKVDAEGNIL